jgi:hypothetical protein
MKTLVFLKGALVKLQFKNAKLNYKGETMFLKLFQNVKGSAWLTTYYCNTFSYCQWCVIIITAMAQLKSNMERRLILWRNAI